MKRKSSIYIILLYLSFACSCSDTRNLTGKQDFILFRFGCCFKNDSIKIYNSGHVIFEGIISSNDNTSQDDKNIFIVRLSEIKEEIINLYVEAKGKKMPIRVDKKSDKKFGMIFFTRELLTYEMSDRPLYGL